MRAARLVCLVLVACAAAAFAAEDSAVTRARARINALRAEVEARPADPTPHYLLAIYHARIDETQEALAELGKTADLGDGFTPSPDLDFPKQKDTPEFRAVMEKFAARNPRTPDAPLAFLIPDSHLVPEGIAYDPHSGDFFVGSGPQRRIVRVSPKGGMSALSDPADGLASVLGLKVDAATRRLYAVTSDAYGYGGGDNPTNRIVAYDLGSGRKVGDWRIDGASELNDLALGPRGEIFVTDSARGTVWLLDQASGTSRLLLPAGTFGNINGIAASADGELLFFAHSLGVSRYAVASGQHSLLALPPRQMVAGIDGLYFWQGNLLGVQNVTTPGRVILIRLNPEGTAATAVETLQSSHHPLFDTPTTGAVGPDGFYVLARTQIGLYDPQAGFTAPDHFLPPAVIRVPLPAGARQ